MGALDRARPALAAVLVVLAGGAVIARAQSPAESPSSSLTGAIAFASARAGDYDIYTMNADGTAITRVAGDEGADVDPAWSPDGSQIAFASTRDGDSDIYVVGARGEVRQLTDIPGAERFPAWSADGTTIAFRARGRERGPAQIWLMAPDGSGQRRIVTKRPADQPAWSPDGKRIAFTGSQRGNDEIFVMDVDGSNLVNITNSPASDRFPDWSPDGSRIVFRSLRDRESGREIFVMKPDGSDLREITHSRGPDRLPSWSRDGRRIAFVSARDGNDEIYTMNADGSALTRVTIDPASDIEPRWRVPAAAAPGAPSTPGAHSTPGVTTKGPAAPRRLAIRVTAAPRQRAARRHGLFVTVRCSRACGLTVSARAGADRGRALRLRAITKALSAGRAERFFLRVTTLKALATWLRHHRYATVRISVIARDKRGGRARTARALVRVVR